MLDYAFIQVGCHGADLLKLLKQVCSCSVHDGRRRPPRDAHAPRTLTVAAAAGNKETPLLAADVRRCSVCSHRIHRASAACMCPVVHVCHHFTCHRPYAQSMLYCALYGHWLRHICHTLQWTHIIYISMVRLQWRRSRRCAKYSNSVYVSVFRTFLTPSAS